MKTLLKHPTITKFISKMPTVKQLFFTVLGAILLTFLFLSLLSYNINDPAWSHVGHSETTTNIMGRLGAWISDILRVFFGLGAWWLIVALCFEMMRLWWKHEAMAWQLRAVAHIFLLIFISGLLSGLGASTDTDTSLWFGGVVGHELYGSLVVLFGKALSFLFLGVLIVIVASLTLNIPYKKLFKAKTQNSTPIPPKETKSAQKEPKDSGFFSIITPKKTTSSTPVPTESLGEFLQNSGLKEKVLSRHLSILQDKAQNESESEQEPTTHQDSLPQTKEAEHEPKPNVITTKVAEQTTGKSYIDSRGVGVTTVHTNVKIHHADTYKTNAIDKNINNDISNTAQQTATSDDATYPSADTHEFYQPHDDFDAPDDTAQLNAQPSLGSDEIFQAEIETAKPIAHLDNQDFHQTAHQDLDSTPKPVAPPVAPNIHTDSKKSRAMSTLEYRMSLSPVPELSLLDPAPPKKTTYTPEELERLSELLEIKLQEFNINAKVVSAIVGPVVTRFEVELAAGVKVSRVTKIAQDLARSMSMASLRVLPVIVGKPYIGIEVPNRHREIVGLIELLQTDDYQDPNAGISIAIGQDISGRPVIADLAKAPHMLVAGTTGSGKSVLVNSFLLSMLLKYTPDELKLVLIDPKQLELANYADIPHLLTPVITDMTEATAVLNWCVTEMERRYALIGSLKVRQLTEFNKKVLNAEKTGEPLLDPLWQAGDHVGDRPPKLKPLPKIVVVADEFADMIMQLGKTAEEPIVRLAQKARAAGIHLILATQRPVASVVTGLIKSNVPSRVALRVNSAIDSRLIIEESGAENMLGHGDMMFLAPGKNTTERVHGAYVKDDEVNRVTDAWRERGTPDYIDLSSSYSFEGEGSGNVSASNGDEEYYNQAVAFFVESKKVSISSLQRKLSIGYNKAARLVDLMEERGVVSSPDNSGKRQLLI